MSPVRPALWVELCAGSAAVTLRLLGGAGARPPVSYIGGKRAYGRAILNVMGLQSGVGADAVVLIEAGPWAKVWAAMIDPVICKRVAGVLRGWKDEDPKDLWDRLKKIPVPADPADFAAAWTYLQARNFSAKPNHEDGLAFGTAGFKNEAPVSGSHLWATSEPGPADVARGVEDAGRLPWPMTAADAWAHWVARWLWVNGRSFGSKGEAFGFDGSNGHNPDQAQMARAIDRLSQIHWPRIDPEHVAQWIFQQGASYGGLFGSGHAGYNYMADHSVVETAKAAEDMHAAPWPAVAVVQADVATVDPPSPLPDPTYVYMDPPYEGVTGYQHSLSRDKVIEVAQRWAAAGAIVAVSEDDPLPIHGWHHVEITECFTGMGRTFSRSRSEWITMNRDPAWKPDTQMALFTPSQIEGQFTIFPEPPDAG